MSECEGLSELFREARIKAGLTQWDVARALGYSSAQYISNWERGMCGVPLSAMSVLIPLLGLKKSEVMQMILENERQRLERMFRPSVKR